MYGDLICGDKQKYDFYENDTAAAAKIKRAISTLGCYNDDCVIVNLNEDILYGTGLFSLTIKHCFNLGETNLYRLQLKIKNKGADGINETVYTVKTNKQNTFSIFDMVCIQRQMPDISTWEDISEELFGKGLNIKDKRREKYCKFFNWYFYKHDSEDEWYPQYKKLSKDAWEEYGSEYTEYLTEDYEKYGKYGLIKEMFFKRNNDPVLACIIGDIEYNGYLGNPDYKKAYKYYSHSAKRGYILAKIKLARMYKDGVCAEKNYKKYEKLVRLAYKEMVKERGEYLTYMCSGYLLSELAHIEQENGNIENSLKYMLNCYEVYKDFAEYDNDLRGIINIKKTDIFNTAV